MSLYTYDSKKFAFLFGGVPATGKADGDFIQLELDEDDWSVTRGADGNVVRSNNQNVIATCTLMLQQTSPYNDFLSGIALVDKATGQGVKPVIVKDILGSTKIFSGQAFISKRPAVNRAIEQTNNEWQFKIIRATYFVGGNLPNI